MAKRSQKVLVVEDEEIERRLLVSVLRREGFKVHATSSVEHAMDYVPDRMAVVLTDLHLGDGNGFNLFARWKEVDPETVFIFLTGDREPLTAVEAMKMGASDYLTKPVKAEKLIEVLERGLGGLHGLA